MSRFSPFAALFFLVFLAVVYGRPSASNIHSGQAVLRLGYFPNVTHAPAVVGMAQGEFQRELGKKTAIDAKVFNAGPEEMAALMAGEIDVAYVGPGPAINAFYRTQGRALVVLAGACEGGASLVASPNAGIKSVKDLDGKRVAVPQLGGTQDISLRHFLAQNGLKSSEKGGSVSILPIKNPDILALFQRGQLDAAWVPEPWATRLITEASAKLVTDERDLWPGKKFTTTVIVSRKKYWETHPDEVLNLLKAHLETVKFLNANPKDGQKIVNAELKRLTGKPLKPEELKASWTRLTFTADPDTASLQAFVSATSEAGTLPPGAVQIAQFVDDSLLKRAQMTLASRK